MQHPNTGSGIDVFDPRVIAILPANPGVSFNYPTLDAASNNSVILEPDGYTKLHDNIGGAMPGNTNPFMAYFKDQPYRTWSSTGVTDETKRWQMNLAGFGGPLNFILVVDIATQFPDPPTPIEDNALEPVQIEATIGQGLSDIGGTADVTVTLLDWQGRSTVGGVLVEAPDLIDGVILLSYITEGPNPNEYVYRGSIENVKLAPAGEYKYLVSAWDQGTVIYTYNEFIVNVPEFSYDGSLIWAKRAKPGRGAADKGYGITTLSDNSTVVTGYFNRSATFGPDEPNETILTSAGNNEIFIARYNPDGTLAWAKRAGGEEYDRGRRITTLSDDTTVMTGYFQDSVTFGQGEPNETVLEAYGEDDIFIARYNTDGTLAWAKSAGGGSYDYGYAITTLSDDSIIVTGGFNVRQYLDQVSLT